MMYFTDLNDIIYNRWNKDDCEDIIVELFFYQVFDEILRTVMNTEDENITKQFIMDTAKKCIDDPDVIDDARSLSRCFEEVL